MGWVIVLLQRYAWNRERLNGQSLNRHGLKRQSLVRFDVFSVASLLMQKLNRGYFSTANGFLLAKVGAILCPVWVGLSGVLQ